MAAGVLSPCAKAASILCMSIWIPHKTIPPLIVVTVVTAVTVAAACRTAAPQFLLHKITPYETIAWKTIPHPIVMAVVIVVTAAAGRTIPCRTTPWTTIPGATIKRGWSACAKNTCATASGPGDKNNSTTNSSPHWRGVCAKTHKSRHCERSKAIQQALSGLLRCARNDG